MQYTLTGLLKNYSRMQIYNIFFFIQNFSAFIHQFSQVLQIERAGKTLFKNIARRETAQSAS